MYHLSDIKKFLRCERLYYYSKDDTNVFKPFLRSDENIIDLIKLYFGISDCFEGQRNDENERFFSECEKYEWFIRPRFVDGQLRINVPLLHRKNKEFDLYFLYYGISIKEIDTISFRSSLQILKKLDIDVKNVFLIYFNPDYVYHKQLEVNKLFLITDEFKEKKIIDYLNEDRFDYDSIVSKMDRFSIEESSAKKNRSCRLNGVCDYYRTCFPDEEELDDDSILTLVSSGKKNYMYEQGMKYLKDALPDLLEGNRVQYAQIMASRNGGLYLDKNALRYWLNKLSERPISFVDFEWDRYIVPAYENMKPMDVLCFEFALYYLDANGNLEHRTFIGTGDCRKDFIEALINYLPETGPILAYNSVGAECLRLKELSEYYPEYKEKLQKIIDRFYDLATPFSEGLIYDVRMKGDFSLKKLVGICSDYSYKDLDIDDGMSAVFNWRDLDKNADSNDEKILANLEEYCSLDAYGLFLVYKWLVELVVDSNKSKKEEDL